MLSAPRSSVALVAWSLTALVACGEPFAASEGGAGGTSGGSTTSGVVTSTGAGGAGTGAGGAGHGGAASGGHAPGGAGHGGGAPCLVPSDCVPSGPCVTATCADGACAETPLPSDTPLPPESQTAHDCLQLRCDGVGHTASAPDDGDDPLPGPDPCKERRCQGGSIVEVPADAGIPCTPDKQCDGAGKCLQCWQGGPICDDPTTCQQGVCVPPLCSNGQQDAGESDVDCGGATCAPCGNGKACAGAGDCASGFCAGNACAPCTKNLDCGADAFCGPGQVCAPTSGPGVACGADAECATGFCADHVCCDKKCDGPCQECTTHPGECKPVADGAQDAACAGNGGPCGMTGLCAGGACAFAKKDTFCGVDCNVGEQVTSRCDGAGSCALAEKKPCAPFLCQGTVCAFSCSSDQGCVAPLFCDADSQCKPRKNPGAPCKTSNECVSNSCSGGFCQ